MIFVPRQILRFVRFGLVRRRFAFTDAAAIQSRRGSHRLMCRGLALLWLCIVCGWVVMGVCYDLLSSNA